MTNGNKVYTIILDYLSTQNLSHSDKATITNADSGSYEPESVFDILNEVNELIEANDTTGLIKLLKVLPKPSTDNNITLYVDNKPVNFNQFSQATPSSRSVKGASTTSNSMWESIKAQRDEIEENRVVTCNRSKLNTVSHTISELKKLGVDESVSVIEDTYPEFDEYISAKYEDIEYDAMIEELRVWLTDKENNNVK